MTRSVAAFLFLALAGCAVRAPDCMPVGVWVSPAIRATIPDPLPGEARRAVVLLGEHHDSAADHRWQMQSIEALYAANSHMALGFEMFPRRVQPVLDRWVKGEFADDQAFLDAVEWKRVWNIDSALYLPIFRFAREHRLPMLALNVDRGLVRRVGQEGWDKIPLADRDGVGNPAPPTDSYRKYLVDVMAAHGGKSPVAQEKLDNFIAAQLLWDRAMAEAIAAARDGPNPPLVVAILGAEHIADRNGVPHQLEALGIHDSAVLLPWARDESCADLDPGLADAVYGEAGKN